MTDVKVGDYVEVTKDRTWTDADVGGRGTLAQIDENDEALPYRVYVDGNHHVWVMDVRRVDPPTTPDREALVSRAKELLRGTHYDASDLIRMAEFLAGDN